MSNSSSSSSQSKPRALALLDRDGCLIEERHYLSKPEEVKLFPDAIKGLQLLEEQNIARVLCTNQSGVARGFFSEQDVENVHLHLSTLLNNEGASLDQIYTATHHPDAEKPEYRQDLHLRKPETGMAEIARMELELGTAPCFAIGDKWCDVEFGENSGGFGILVKTGHGEKELASKEAKPKLVAENFYDAVLMALNELIKREYPEDEMLREKLRTRGELKEIVSKRKAAGERVGFANGCFDLLHGGHISFLENSREAGDCLVLGLNSNTSITRLKGKERPILEEAARIQLLASLRSVDYITIFYEDSADETLRTILPTYHTKGTDYKHDNVPELVTTRSLGIETVIAGDPKENSTRDIIEVIGERTAKNLL